MAAVADVLSLPLVRNENALGQLTGFLQEKQLLLEARLQVGVLRGVLRGGGCVRIPGDRSARGASGLRKRSRMPRAGTWMVWVKRVFALAMLVMAEYYLVKMGQVYF